MSNLMERETQFNFIINITASDTEYLSSVVFLSDMPWYIRVLKRLDGKKRLVDVFLVCSFVSTDMIDWFCAAKMSVTLQSIAPNRSPHVKRLPPTEFTNRNPYHGLFAFIEMAELRHYMRNGKVSFDIHLSMNPAIFVEPRDIEKTHTKFRFIVESISELYSCESHTLVLRGTRWKVKVERTVDDFLCILLCDERNPSNNYNWEWTVTYTFELLSFDKNIKLKCNENIVHTFYSNGENWGYPQLISWNQLMDESKNYVKDDKVVFEIVLEVQPPQPAWRIVPDAPKSFKSFTDLSSVCLALTEPKNYDNNKNQQSMTPRGAET